MGTLKRRRDAKMNGKNTNSGLNKIYLRSAKLDIYF